MTATVAEPAALALADVGQPRPPRLADLADFPPALVLAVSNERDAWSDRLLAAERDAYARGRADQLADDLADDAAAYARGRADAYATAYRAGRDDERAAQLAERGQLWITPAVFPAPGDPRTSCPVCGLARGPAGICCGVPGPDRPGELAALAVADVGQLRRQLADALAALDVLADRLAGRGVRFPQTDSPPATVPSGPGGMAPPTTYGATVRQSQRTQDRPRLAAVPGMPA